MLVKGDPMAAGSLHRGLSCGAASALVAAGGTVYKLKRCGFRTEGFRKGRRNRYHETIGEDIVEDLVLAERPFGLLGAEGAWNEVRIVERLRAFGLCDAYRPIGVFTFSVRGATADSDVAAAALCEVTSDLRGDELFFAMLVCALAASARQGEFAYVPDQRRFELRGLKLRSVLTDIAEGRAHRRLRALGKAVGGAHRRLHGTGFIRGYNNTWFGNDVVGPDGQISLIDHDNSVVLPEDPLPGPLRAYLRSMNCYGYTAQLWQEATRFSVLPISAGAMEIATGFDEGYRDGAEPSIGPELLRDIVAEYLEHRAAVMGEALP
jgi:hypothetical protein